MFCFPSLAGRNVNVQPSYANNEGPRQQSISYQAIVS